MELALLGVCAYAVARWLWLPFAALLVALLPFGQTHQRRQDSPSRQVDDDVEMGQSGTARLTSLSICDDLSLCLQERLCHHFSWSLWALELGLWAYGLLVFGLCTL